MRLPRIGRSELHGASDQPPCGRVSCSPPLMMMMTISECLAFMHAKWKDNTVRSSWGENRAATSRSSSTTILGKITQVWRVRVQLMIFLWFSPLEYIYGLVSCLHINLWEGFRPSFPEPCRLLLLTRLFNAERGSCATSDICTAAELSQWRFLSPQSFTSEKPSLDYVFILALDSSHDPPFWANHSTPISQARQWLAQVASSSSAHCAQILGCLGQETFTFLLSYFVKISSFRTRTIKMDFEIPLFGFRHEMLLMRRRCENFIPSALLLTQACITRR